MKILVTGANGMIGQAAQQFYALRPEINVYYTDISPLPGFIEMNVRDYSACEILIKSIQPDVIIHLAGFCDLDKCEERDFEREVIATNLFGTDNITCLARKYNCKLVFISSGGIFAGNKMRKKESGLVDTTGRDIYEHLPYTEYDPPQPINIYALSMLMAEQLIQYYLNDYLVIRTSWLFGGGDHDTKFVKRIVDEIRNSKNANLYVVENQYGIPTSTSELIRALDFLVSENVPGIFNFACGGSPVSRKSLADIIAKSLNINKNIVGVKATHFAKQFPAPRPSSEVLENFKLRMRYGYQPKDWKEELKDYLTTL